jgi:5-deoxy-D-glucuronate isomerase
MEEKLSNQSFICESKSNCSHTTWSKLENCYYYVVVSQQGNEIMKSHVDSKSHDEQMMCSSTLSS